MGVLVTGAAGFVGNNIISKLVKAGKTVRAVVHNMEKADKRLADYKGAIEIVKGDVTKRGDWPALMHGITTVIHTVAIPMEKGGQTYDGVNYHGTVNVVDAAVQGNVPRFIFISQNGANANLPYRFLASKGKAQDYVERSKLGSTILRPSAIFGPQDEFFNTFARLVKLTPLVFPLIGGGKAEFQPVSVLDVAEAAVRSIDDESTIGKAFDLGGPEVLTIGEIEKRVVEALGTKRAFVPAPVPLLRPAVWLMERVLPGSPVNSSLLDLLAVPNTVPDNALVNFFKMQPIPFSGSNIAYLRNNSVGQALNKFFKNATVN
jgi:uncharacterized protein YbjT (DUF2867 family)